MNKWNVKKNEYTDIYRRLEIQLSTSWNDTSVQSKDPAWAYLYAKTLKAIEDFVLDIEDNKLLILDQSDKKDKTEAAIKQIQEYCSQLVYDQKWFLEEHHLSESAQVFLEECDKIELQLIIRERLSTVDQPASKIPRFLNMPEAWILQDRSFDFAKNTDSLVNLVKSIRARVQLKSTQTALWQRQNLANKEKQRVVSYSAACFKACPQLFILCMDLGYRPTIINFDAQLNQIKFDWEQLVDQLNTGSDTIGCLAKLEYSALRGLYLHCTFFLKHQEQRADEYWAGRIGVLWGQITSATTQYRGYYYNCNPSIQSISEKNPVGIIKDTDHKKRANFEHSVIDYMTLSLQFLSVKVPDQHPVLFFGKTPISNASKIVASSNTPKQNTNSALSFSEKELQAIWTITPDHVTPERATSIKDATIIYNELKSLTMSGSTGLLLTLGVTVNVEYLLKIETLVTLIRSNNQPAFDLINGKYLGSSSQEDIARSRTQIGKQLVDLDSKIGVVHIANSLSSFLKYLSINVNIFCTAIQRMNCALGFNVGSDYPWVQRNPEFYNGFVTSIRNLLNDEISQLPAIDQRRRLLELKPHTNNTHEKPRGSKNIKALIAKEQRDAIGAFETARNYVRSLFIKDVTLISLKLYAYHNKGDIPHHIFSPLFTTFMRIGQNCYPMSQILGYIGRWEQVDGTRLCAHVIFFMDANISGVEQTARQIEAYWIQTIRDQKKTKKYLAELSIDQIHGHATTAPIFSSLLDFKDFTCKIELKDKAKQEAFNEHVTLYLTKSTLYFQPNQTRFPKAPIRGNGVKKTSDKPFTPKNKKIKEESFIEVPPSNFIDEQEPLNTVVPIQSLPTSPVEIQVMVASKPKYKTAKSSSGRSYSVREKPTYEPRNIVLNRSGGSDNIASLSQTQKENNSQENPLTNSTEVASDSSETIECYNKVDELEAEVITSPITQEQINDSPTQQKCFESVDLEVTSNLMADENDTLPSEAELAVPPTKHAFNTESPAWEESKIVNNVLPNLKPMTKLQAETMARIAYGKEIGFKILRKDNE